MSWKYEGKILYFCQEFFGKLINFIVMSEWQIFTSQIIYTRYVFRTTGAIIIIIFISQQCENQLVITPHARNRLCSKRSHIIQDPYREPQSPVNF